MTIAVRKLIPGADLTASLKKYNIIPGGSYKIAAYRDAMESETGVIDSIVMQCYEEPAGTFHLSEVRICVGRASTTFIGCNPLERGKENCGTGFSTTQIDNFAEEPQPHHRQDDGAVSVSDWPRSWPGKVPLTEMFGTFALSFGAAVGTEFWARWAHRALWHPFCSFIEHQWLSPCTSLFIVFILCLIIPVTSWQSRTLFPSLFCTGGRLKKLYRSWEDDPDIGFVTMKW
ncbi:hypothetical protein LWI28_018013 [Acer negundo]|uniref:beta-carotene 3-hydroxylase n=1 Tax=Acer negundo TaxID=4023 RepID=A0AAD5NUY8_ACENE|nr:hypothetical protein LWI28_018013 [Acer negundo]